MMRQRENNTGNDPAGTAEYDPLHLAKPGEKCVICPECGLPVPVSMKYCPFCGIRMRGGCTAMIIKTIYLLAAAAAVIWLIRMLF